MIALIFLFYIKKMATYHIHVYFMLEFYQKIKMKLGFEIKTVVLPRKQRFLNEKFTTINKYIGWIFV